MPRQYNAAFDLLQRNLQAGRGDKTAFIDDRRSLTYWELDRLSDRFANLLQASRVLREQRIVLCLQDSIDFPIAFLGTIKAGVVPVPINSLLTASDYEYVLNDCRAPIAVVSAALRPLFEPLVDRVASLNRLIVAGAPSDLPDSLTSAMEGFSDRFPTVETVADEPCFWLYSSGSTGPPKGTIHQHASLVQTAELYARPILGIAEHDVAFSAAKLFFAYGLGNALTFPMSVGATAILMAERPTPSAVFERLRRHMPTIFSGVPTLYASMLASPDLPARSELRLRRCNSAGEALPEEIARKWAAHYGVDILDGIGSTEMLHIFLSNRPDDVRYGTTGRPVPGYRVRLVDDQGQDVAAGEIGELQVSGPTSALYYWNQREKTRATFHGPWTRCGDKFFETSEGRFVFAGRSDDMLKVGGIYVSPAEVESALISHDCVLEAAVVGQEDGDRLVKPLAYVVLKDGHAPSEALADTLKGHVKGLLAPYKYPRWIQFIDELPKTATGKILRFKLRPKARE